MTLVYVSLALGFFAPVGSIAHTMWRDVVNCQTEADLGVDGEYFGRLTAPLPDRRAELLPEDFYQSWPQRQTPSDLPPRVGFVVAADRPGKHRSEELTTTGQFWAIVDDSLRALAEPCTHCSTPEDGEPGHAGCPGCSCWCSLPELVEVR